MAIGIRNIFRVATIATVISSVAPVSVAGLGVPVGNGQKVKLRYWLLINEVNAAPGVRFILSVPAGAGSIISESYLIMNTVTDVSDGAAADTSTPAVPVVITAALANIGVHYAIIDVDYVNGVTPGTINLQFAQSVSSANNTQILVGSTVEAVYE